MGDVAAGLSNGLNKRDDGTPGLHTEPNGRGEAAHGPSAELKDLVRLGMDELVAKARRGELRPRHVGLAIKGARRYHAAIAAGDIAGDGDQRERAAACLACEHHRTRGLVLREADGAERAVVAGYCGEPMDGDRRPGGPCGCLVTVTVGGVATAHGRAMVASEACPLGEALGGPKWCRVVGQTRATGANTKARA